MSRIFKTAASVLALLLVIAMALVGCGTQGGGETNSGAKTTGSVKKIIEAFDAKEYEEAYELFAEKELDAEQQASLVEALGERIDKAVSDFAADDMDSEAARRLLTAAQSFNLSKLKTKLTTSMSELNDLSASKTEYANGLIAFSKQDWVGAVEAFSKVVEKDCNHEDAAKKSDEAVQKLMDGITSQIALGEYDTALQLAEQLRSLRPTDTNVAAKIAEINSAKAEQELEAQRTEALNAAQESYDQGNYAAAFDTLDDYIKDHRDDQQAIDALAQHKDNYVNMIVQKTDEAMQKQEYLRALDMLNNAIAVLPDQRLTAKKTELDAVKPTYLCELACADSKNYEAVSAGNSYKSVTGVEYDYDYGNLFCLKVKDVSKGYAKYFLNYGYKTFRCTIDVLDDSSSMSFKLKIIGDGVVLKTIDMSKQFSPLVVELDVANVGWLEFDTPQLSIGVVNYKTLNILIANAYLEK